MTIEKEIEECYNATKNWEHQTHNKQYYRGVHHAYLHLMRLMGKANG